MPILLQLKLARKVQLELQSQLAVLLARKEPLAMVREIDITLQLVLLDIGRLIDKLEGNYIEY